MVFVLYDFTILLVVYMHVKLYVHCTCIQYYIYAIQLTYCTIHYSPSTTTPPTTDAISLVKCTDPLPLEQYLNTITAHFQTRQRIALLSAQLNDAAHQYRMVEKRLLVRYKDRNPTPLSGLDSLMKEAYDRLIALSK